VPTSRNPLPLALSLAGLGAKLRLQTYPMNPPLTAINETWKLLLGYRANGVL